MSKNVKLEPVFKSDFIVDDDDFVFKNYNETDVLIREEAQFLASQFNRTLSLDPEQANEDEISNISYDYKINGRSLLEDENQEKFCSIIEKNNKVLNKILDKISINSNPIIESQNVSDFNKNVIEKEKPLYELIEKNTSFLIDYFENEILNIKESIKKDKSYMNETNKEILSYLEDQEIVKDILSNKDLSEKIERSIDNRVSENNSVLNKNLNFWIDDVKNKIENLRTEIRELDYKEKIEEILNNKIDNNDSIDFFKKDIYTKIEYFESELKQLNYRKELDNLFAAQLHQTESVSSSNQELHHKISNIENDFLNRIHDIELKINSNSNILSDLKDSYNSNEIDNLITDKLVAIVQEKINNIDSKMLFLKKEIENNLSNLIENKFEKNLINNDEYNKKIKNETLSIIYSELNKFNNKFENLNEEIIKNYDLLMINNRVLDTLEDLLTDQYSKKNDLDVERKNLIDELIKKAEHNKELIIILQNKIDYSIDNTDLYNSIIRKTISRDSNLLKEIDDQTYTYVKNLTLELVSKELGKYTNFVKSNDANLETEQIKLTNIDDLSTHKAFNSKDLIQYDKEKESKQLESIIHKNHNTDSRELKSKSINTETIDLNNFEHKEYKNNAAEYLDMLDIQPKTSNEKLDNTAFEKDVFNLQLDDSETFLPHSHNNSYFNYKIKELLAQLMNNENESMSNDIAFYKANLLNINSGDLEPKDYVKELENYFSTIENIGKSTFNKGELNE